MLSSFDIKANEQFDWIEENSLGIIQKRNGFRYGTDAVMLADFAGKNVSGKVMDLCSGTAIVPLLLSRYKRVGDISALEIQQDIADMANRSVLGNSLEDKIDVICGDLKNIRNDFSPKSFDCVTCNPPYMKLGNAIINETDTKTISRHEVCCNLDDVISAGKYLLKDFGRLYMVHKPNRTAEIIHTLCNYKLEPKRMRFVHSKLGKEPSLVLIEAMAYGGAEIRIEPPLFIYNDDGTYTDALKSIYKILGT